MAPMDRPKRMLVRTSIVAGSTVATLIGAQTLITVDKQNPKFNGSANTVEVQVQSTSVPQQQQSQPIATTVVHALPTINIVHTAPIITIVRQTGQVNNQPVQTVATQPTGIPAQVVIKPPVPVQVAAPAPIIVQQPGNSQASAPSSGGGGQQQPAPAPRTHSS